MGTVTDWIGKNFCHDKQKFNHAILDLHRLPEGYFPIGHFATRHGARSYRTVHLSVSVSVSSSLICQPGQHVKALVTN